LNFVEFVIFQIKAVIVRSKELLQQVKEEIATQVQQALLEKEIAAQTQQKHGTTNALT
jgi:hypothetical protein